MIRTTPSTCTSHVQSFFYITIFIFRRAFLNMSPAKYTISKCYISHLGHFWTVPNPNICFRPKRRAPKNNADWCNRFVQNSHGEPIGDKTDSCQICSLARGEVSEMPPAKYTKSKYKKVTVTGWRSTTCLFNVSKLEHGHRHRFRSSGLGSVQTLMA